MAHNGAKISGMKCTSCGSEVRLEVTLMPMWLASELNIIEGVPAHICEKCDTQYYEPHVEAAIRALVATGFPAEQALRHMNVPVFGLDRFFLDIDKPVQSTGRISIETETRFDN